ncbi:Methionine aminopeptidase 1D, mitochondrial [Sparganum proliferum]
MALALLLVNLCVDNTGRSSEETILCVHGDACVTFLVPGESRLRSTPTGISDLLLCAQKCCQAGVSACGPGVPYRCIAEAVSQVALSCGNFRVVAGINGHGIGTYFHGPPDICHCIYEERTDDRGVMCPGHVFTIEPCVAAPSVSSAEGAVESYVALPFIQPDGWSVRTSDHALTAQFEEMVLITDDGYDLLTR